MRTAGPAILLVLAGGTVVACAPNPTLIRGAQVATRALRVGSTVYEGFRPFTLQEEDAIGRYAFLEILRRFPPVDDDTLHLYVNRVLHVLVAHAPDPLTFRGWRVAVVSMDKPNAFSTPGGYVALSLPLLTLLESEDELAAVLAHEVAHVVRRHGLASVRRARKAQAIQVLSKEVLDLGDYEALIADIGGGLVHLLLERGFSRKEELEADSLAWDMLRQAGYTPHALSRVLEKLEARTPDSGTPGFLRTHPSIQERRSRLRGRGSAPEPPPSSRIRRFTRYVEAYR